MTQSQREQNTDLSIVAPAFNEQANVDRLVREVHAAFDNAPVTIELIVVDDCSDDQTHQRLIDLAKTFAWLKPLRHTERMGQSAALFTAIRAAHGRLVATLDADLQNDPADLLTFMHLIDNNDADLVQGSRTRRADSLVKKVTSWVGRTARKALLGDTIRDTGCSTRIMRSEVAKALPLHLAGMHRFIPVYAKALGAKVVERPANHRARSAGVTKYGIGNRALSGLMDCLAVRWMLRRIRVSPLTAPTVQVEDTVTISEPTHAA